MSEDRTLDAPGGAALRRVRILAWIAVFATLPFFIYFLTARFQAKTPPAARDALERLALERASKSLAAPDFTLESLSGKRLSLKDLRGKVVFLNFWATWCVPCRDEMPLMEALHREFKNQGLAVVAVNFREDKEAVRRFFDELGLSFDPMLDVDGEVSEQYGAFSLPLTYLIDRDGRFVGKAVGIRPWDGADAKAFIRELLERKP
jgi:thiol-disulfide isomerase/thioredoxin